MPGLHIDAMTKYVQQLAQALQARLERRKTGEGARYSKADATAIPVNAEYEIIKYRPEHKPLVADLQSGLWSTDRSLNRRYLEWKHERNPYSDEPLIYLAFHQGKPVGMRGFHEARLEAGTPSRIFPVLIGGDAFVAPEHRNRGLVTRIMKMAYSDLADRAYPYLVSVGGANRINVLGLLTLGWKSAGMLKTFGRISGRTRLTRDLSRALAGLPVLWRFSDADLFYSADQHHPFRHLDEKRVGHGAGEELPIIVERQPRLESMVALVEQLGHDGRLRYVRDRQYLAWRFANPLSEYRFLYWEGKPHSGYLVLSRRASDIGAWNRVYIADLEATDMQIRAELISAAIRWGQFPELVTWTSSLSEQEIQILRNRAFVPVDQRDTARGVPCVMVRSIGEQSPGADWMLGDRRILDPANWDTRVLYSMRG